MLGIINLHKPAGKTSHDMVSFVRRTLGEKRVGHSGTLDPDATGVLPVCVGKATKVAQMIMGSDKEYVAELAFGSETDTQDASGQ
ncbi:MAG: tRNA pseudouridine(55) synthase TruB, partial [Clostridia bacterium]|nr:tRNA pseudouridine(55) synthase TruB [Clostridia bacterium]